MRTTIGTHARTRRGLMLTALAGVALSSLAACGGSSSGSAATGAGSAAVAASASSPSVSSPAKASGQSAGARSVAELNSRVASAAKAKGTVRLVMTPSATTGQRATGVMRFRGSGVDFAMTVGMPGGKTLKMILVDGTAYMNVGEKYQGKNWIRISPDGSDPLSKALGPMFAQLSTGLDLDTQFAGAQDAKITAATPTTLAGVPATKYRLVSSETGFLAQIEKVVTDPAVRNTLRAQFKGAHSESVMWISKDDLPLRVESRVVGGKAPGTTATVTYSDWGKPVSITAPRRGDTANLVG
jgi:hypothetical protein